MSYVPTAFTAGVALILTAGGAVGGQWVRQAMHEPDTVRVEVPARVVRPASAAARQARTAPASPARATFVLRELPAIDRQPVVQLRAPAVRDRTAPPPAPVIDPVCEQWFESHVWSDGATPCLGPGPVSLGIAP